MDIPWLQIFENMLYFLAVLNPASKILFLTAYEPPLSFRQTLELSWKSSLAALLMLVTFALLGQMVLQEVFRIEMYSLRAAGGLILFFTGWMAVREGRFFQQKDGNVQVDFTELSIIPLAAPLISGPGTITIALSLAAEHGSWHCITVVTLAILVNFGLMICALPINRGLLKMHLAGPVIRITGLVVATVAIQMILSGLGEWVLTLQSGQLPVR
ncbi:MAG: MarC family protein [Oligosphaeraceae bacterium]|nr:MarC family protein [Oligosphaeraceae bacterium]